MDAPIDPADLATTPPRARCRQIEDADLPAVTQLLAEGFPRRSRRFWERGLRRLSERTVPQDSPRYGVLLEAGDAVVGCLLLIVSEQAAGDTLVRRTNVSSWYVKPAYRVQASMLVSVAFRQKNTTFVNISPAPHTLPILEAQGYRRYAAGQVIAAPLFVRRHAGVRLVRFSPDDMGFGQADLPELEMLRRHARAGCIVLLCRDGDRLEPFVFVRRRIIRTIVPAAQLLWCRDMAAFERYAGTLGRHLLRLGRFAVSVDANGPMRGLPGVWRPGNAPKYFRGPDRPRLGDLADTELVYLGA